MLVSQELAATAGVAQFDSSCCELECLWTSLLLLQHSCNMHTLICDMVEFISGPVCHQELARFMQEQQLLPLNTWSAC